MPPHEYRDVEVLHDDGDWYAGTLLHAYKERSSGRWRAVVRYYRALGEQYQRGVYEDRVRKPGSGPVVDISGRLPER